MAVIHACSILFHLRRKHLLRNAKTIGNEVTAALDPAANYRHFEDSSDVNRVLQMLLNLRQVCNFRNSVRISLLAIPERTDLALPLFEAIAARDLQRVMHCLVEGQCPNSANAAGWAPSSRLFHFKMSDLLCTATLQFCICLAATCLVSLLSFAKRWGYGVPMTWAVS